MAGENEGAAGGAGGDDKGGAGAGAGAGEAKKDEASLIGGAGAKKEVPAGDVDAAAAAAKVAAEKLSADQAKELEGKTPEQKAAILNGREEAVKAAAAKAGEGKTGAPEKYTDFKLPDGLEIDTASMTEFQTVAKELNLSQDGAQKLVDFQAKMEKSRVEASLTEFDQTAKAWREETIKTLGADFDKAQANVGRFLERFGSPELRKLMDATRVGENKHLFSALAKAGAQLGEGDLPKGDKSGQQEEQGKRWYPKMREEMQSSASK